MTDPINKVSLPVIKQRSDKFAPCRLDENGEHLYGYVFLNSPYNQEILDWAESTAGVNAMKHSHNDIEYYSIVFDNDDLISYYKLTFL